MKKIILGVLIVANSYIFASIENEIFHENIQRNNHVVIDNFSGLIWEDTENTGHIPGFDSSWASKTMSFSDAKQYCQNLTLDGFQKFRVPTDAELRYLLNIKKYFKHYNKDHYWSKTRKGSKLVVESFVEDDQDLLSTAYRLPVRCVSGPIYKNYNDLLRIVKMTKNKKINKSLKNKYQNAKNKNSIVALEHFIAKYPNAPQAKQAKKEIKNIYKLNFNKAKQTNTIDSYQNFISKYPNAPQSKEVLQNIYKIVKQKNNIAGYEWFIKEFPNAPQAKEALNNIYKLAFNEAKDIGTIKAYNTFIYSYPLAPQVKEANERAYKMEEKKYTDLGMLSFYDKDKKMEKKARKLLIKAKQIERYPTDNGIEDRKAGYLIVANRMYKLLQDKFDDTDATLRYLESQEFKDFTRSFRDIMSDIKDTLHAIQNNTSSSSRYMKQLVEVSSKGFAEANADRDMASYYTKQHREWEKYMHFRDKGYR